MNSHLQGILPRQPPQPAERCRFDPAPILSVKFGHIISLAETFIAAFNEQYGLGPKRVSEDLRAVLENHQWPGNVRALRAVIESMYVLSANDLLSSKDLPPDLATARSPPSAAMKTIAELERDAIHRELASQSGNRSRVARALGISRSTLYRKLSEYGLE